MFWNKTKIEIEMIPRLNPTSKTNLKQQCLLIAKGDLDKAERLYDYMTKGMDDLPTLDPVPPTTMQQVKETASTTFAWIKDNREDIMSWVGFLQSMFGKGGNLPPTNGGALPPIN